LYIGTRIEFGRGSFGLQLLYWDTGLEYFVADRVHTLEDTEQLVYRDLDWIWSRIIFTLITVLGHRIGLFCRGLYAYFSPYRRTYTLMDTERLVYRDSDWIRSWFIFTTITVLGHRVRIFCRGWCAYFSGYGTTCVLGLGLDLVLDHFYYNYCVWTPDWIILSRIVCIL
jgi:hypothetical protein